MSIPVPVSTALALVLALLFWLAGPAQAAPVSFIFSGALDNVDPTDQLFSKGDRFSGSFTYESLAQDQPGASREIAVYDALTAFRVTIQAAPNITVTTIFSSPPSAAGAVRIENNNGGRDLFDLVLSNDCLTVTGSQSHNCLTGSEINITGVRVNLTDDSGSVFTAGTNPVVPLPTSFNLSQFSSSKFTLEGAGVSGPFETLEPGQPAQPVPEPTTFLLFGATASGLGLARWRRRRQS
jgi:hypothetical protein